LQEIEAAKTIGGNVIRKGRRTTRLSQDHAQHMQDWRFGKGYSIDQLRLALDFRISRSTLQRALDGQPVWDVIHGRLVQWIERYCVTPAGVVVSSRKGPPPPPDGKSAAAGDRES
jgi:hypothetical protein